LWDNRPEVESFYHLSDCPVAGKACSGTACFVARHLNSHHWAQAQKQPARVYCLGQCFAAPATGDGSRARPFVDVRSREAIVLGRLANGGARTLDAYTRLGGFHWDEKECEKIIAALKLTSLCGLGTGLAEFAESALRHYGKELELCWR
jgi:formate dehydrogenase iron-sulfur subunit/NADH-quinone oxidoreductase subunit F